MPSMADLQKSMGVKEVKFNLNLIEFPPITRIDGDIRLYETPEGNRYHSMTTFLKMTAEDDWLQAWRDRIGAEAADAEMARCSRRGNMVHNALEARVLGQPDAHLIAGEYLRMFRQIERLLERDLTEVLGVECQMYSDRLRLAGTSDLIGVFRGEVSICDYKGKNRYNSEEGVEDYFMQLAGYSIMLFERTGIVARQLVLLMAVEGSEWPQCIIRPAGAYLERFKERHEKWISALPSTS